MPLDIANLVSLETLRSLGTVSVFIAFIAICLWAYSGKRRHHFEEAANLPFADEANDHSAESQPSREEKAP